MATTIKGLKTAFKKANARVDKAFARYEKALLPLYMPQDSDNRREYASVYMKCFPRGQFREFATKLSLTFYRKRGGKFYEKPQARRDGFSKEAWDNYRQVYQLVGQDYLDLRKLEKAIDTAIDERDDLLWQLEDLGVDVYKDAELWQ